MNTLFVCFAIIAAASAAQLSPNQIVPILRQTQDVRPDGYEYAYETGNGIAAQEQGVLTNIGQQNEALVVQGANQWTSPEGFQIQTQYVADENGYQPQGAHLPTPPPPQAIPEYILRSIAWNEAHPEQEQPRILPGGRKY